MDSVERQHVERLRGFSRFYTQRLGLLERELLASGFTLAQARVLWELAQRAPLSATQLRADLGLDAGYLSRILRGFRDTGLVSARTADDDARVQRLALTAKGRRAFARLDRASSLQAARLLGALPEPAQARLVDAMGVVRGILTDSAAEVTLHEPQPGDIGWVVQRHGTLYAQEYGWDWRFEALVARICAEFIETYKPARERGWIARRGGVNVGCVFLVQAPPETYGEDVAKLRLLLVEPAARGSGLGAHLVEQCERFARDAGYRRINLWTNSVLLAARAIYRQRGYRLVGQEPHHSFGHDLVGETWEKALG